MSVAIHRAGWRFDNSYTRLPEPLFSRERPTAVSDPALVVVNALRGVALLVDATHETPPAAIVDRVRELAQDPVADVRSSAVAVARKIERLSSGEKPVP